MPDDRGLLRAISWRDLLPWLIIFRTFRLAIGIPLLFLATAGVLLTPLGWWCGRLLFVRDVAVDEDVAFRRIVQYNSRWPGAPIRRPVPDAAVFPYPVNKVFISIPGDAATAFQRLIHPFQQLFDLRWTVSKFAYFLFGGLWTLLVWSFFGGAITRIAAMHLGREERVTLRESMSHAAHYLGSYFTAPLFPLMGVALFSLPIALLGLLMRLDAGVLIAGVVWLLVLLAGLAMAVLLLGLLFGWPLMWGTISAEGSDALDALSRSYSYTFQRPLHYLFYALVAVALGALGWLLVYLLSDQIIALTYWAASWGAGATRVAEIIRAIELSPGGGVFGVGTGLIEMWEGLLRTIAAAFSFSFFWCAATAIYLLLRRDVDQTEFDEIYMEDEDDRHGLPPLKVDPAGVPGVPEPTPAPTDRSDEPPPQDPNASEQSGISPA
jgi:hypothetical protein